jgi:PleD family two-component response regulator
MLEILIEQGDHSAPEGEQARIDGSRQIPNRRRLDEHLLHAWERHRSSRQLLSFLVCDVVARYGGEELAVVLPQSTRESAMLIAERIRAAVVKAECARAGSPENGYLTVSIGVAHQSAAADASGVSRPHLSVPGLRSERRYCTAGRTADTAVPLASAT